VEDDAIQNALWRVWGSAGTGGRLRGSTRQILTRRWRGLSATSKTRGRKGPPTCFLSGSWRVLVCLVPWRPSFVGSTIRANLHM